MSNKIKAVSTHFDVTNRLKDSDLSHFTNDTKLVNNQGSNLLIDPEDVSSGYTHASRKVVAKKIRAKGTTTLNPGRADSDMLDVDTEGGDVFTHADLGMEEDASDDDLPMIDVDKASKKEVKEEIEKIEDELEKLESANDDDDSEFASDEDEVDAATEEEIDADFDEKMNGDDENSILCDFSGTPGDDTVLSKKAKAKSGKKLNSEIDENGGDSLALIDADSVDDNDDGENLAFAKIQDSIHAIRGNRIIATITEISAKKAGTDEIYKKDNFKDIVQASIYQNGLRKGLVSSGFVLAQVKVNSTKHAKQFIEARVKMEVAAQTERYKKLNKAMDQSFAIAATGINTSFFKESANPLRDHLETVFAELGIKGSKSILKSAFAKHGIGYAKAISDLAVKIAAEPDQIRAHYVSALDLINDDPQEEFIDHEDTQASDGDSKESLTTEPSLTAALSAPVRRVPALLQAAKSSAVQKFLVSGNSIV